MVRFEAIALRAIRCHSAPPRWALRTFVVTVDEQEVSVRHSLHSFRSPGAYAALAACWILGAGERFRRRSRG